MISASISLSNKSKFVIDKTSTNNGNNDGNSNDDNDYFYQGNGAKKIYT